MLEKNQTEWAHKGLKKNNNNKKKKKDCQNKIKITRNKRESSNYACAKHEEWSKRTGT